MITTSYVSGIQLALAEQGAVKYASEEEAAFDAEIIGEAIDENLPVDQASLATEGADAHSTAKIAEALIELNGQSSEEKVAEIISDFLNKIAAAAPGDNNVVAGHAPGRVAPGEASAKKTDDDPHMATALKTDIHRDTGFSPSPGKSKIHGGTIGTEKGHAVARHAVKDKIKAMVTAMADNAHRAEHHGKPGHQADKGKGAQGQETKLSEYLASL